MAPRFIRVTLNRWKYVILSVITLYCFLIFPSSTNYPFSKVPHGTSNRVVNRQNVHFRFNVDDVQKQAKTNSEGNTNAELLLEKSEKKASKAYLLSSKKYGDLYIESIVGDFDNSLDDKLNVPQLDQQAPPKIILSWDAQHTAENLNGCTDWNCKFTLDTTKANVSDAILVTRTYKSFSKFRESTQYVVYFSQWNPYRKRLAGI
ncbi:unnamed protein product [Enterobius vermicularis]|uniref:Glyco_tran_10_N domain-containing protein n=1 Tax=Enterobius vermicularis TaxID=51028 RepID=A0A0N4VPZ3_ENTVE|nr:unnamed protein product [Enterobius vermicularis]